MASKIFETVGKLGLGLAIVGGVVNSALYNGKEEFLCVAFSFLWDNQENFKIGTDELV